jgi:hypothetical protein
MAQKKLIETLQEHTHDPHLAIRVTLNSNARPKNLDLVLDKEKSGDCVVKTRAGMNLLLIQGTLATRLEGFILDYEEMMDDFTLEEITRH